MPASTWTTIGNPGREPGAVVWPRGLVTPRNCAWSLDAWLEPERGILLTCETQPETRVRQRLQDRLPVVATAFEERTLRLSTEAWCLVDANGAEWVVVQAVVFNLSEEPTRGQFLFAVRPEAATGPGSISEISFSNSAFTVDGLPAVWLQQEPTAGWSCLPSASAPLEGIAALDNSKSAKDAGGGCLGLAGYNYEIEPWEEAEFIAMAPLDHGDLWPEPPRTPYELLKGRATRRWQQILARGTQLNFPDLRLSESWDASRAHIVTLNGAQTSSDPLISGAMLLANGQGTLAAEFDVLPLALSGEPGLLPTSGAGWDLYASISHLNALIRRRSPDVWITLSQLLRLAGPTFAWPEQMDKQTGAGRGAGHSPLTTAAWLRLARDLLLFEENNAFVIGAGLRPDWFTRPGELVADKIPTSKGALDLTMRWTPAEITLELSAPAIQPSAYEWLLPWPAIVEFDDQQTPAEPTEDGRSQINLAGTCSHAKARPA